MNLITQKRKSKEDLAAIARLASIVDKIDMLILTAAVTRDEIKKEIEKFKNDQVRAGANGTAIDELKEALDKSWQDFNQLWQDHKLRLAKKILEYDCYFCDNCRNYVYDEAAGDPEHGIEPNTHAFFLPPSWHCPSCGASKNELRPSTMLDDYVAAEAGSI